MRRNRIILLTIVFLGFIIAGCGDSTPDTNQKKKTDKIIKKDRQKKKKPKPKPLPAINKLKKSEKSTNASIHFINGTNIRKNEDPTRITNEFIEIKGVAIDRPRKGTAAGVYLKINDQYFKAKYGQKHQAFVRKFKNKKYLKSGFFAKIPKNKFKKGDYDITILVVSNNRNNYYEVKKKTKIKIR